MELLTHFPRQPLEAMSAYFVSQEANNLVVDSLVLSTPEVNAELINELIGKIVSPGVNPNDSAESVLDSQLEVLTQVYRDSATIEDEAGLNVANQKNLVETTEKTLEKVKITLRNDGLNIKASASTFAADVKNINSNERATINTGTSYAELWSRVAVAISNIKSEYVDFYANLMQKYTELYESFNTDLQRASSDAVSTGDDGNNVKFDSSRMDYAYNYFEGSVNSIQGKLGSVKNWSSMSADEKSSMTATLEPAFKVDNNGKITFDLDQYKTVKNTKPSGISDGKVSTASYQAWLATFNAAGSAMQSNMQSFAQRYSQANSTFDNLNKVLSGAISSLSDSASQVLKSIG